MRNSEKSAYIPENLCRFLVGGFVWKGGSLKHSAWSYPPEAAESGAAEDAPAETAPVLDEPTAAELAACADVFRGFGSAAIRDTNE